MKRYLSLILVLLLLLSINVGAVSLPKHKLNISLGDGFAVLTDDSIPEQTRLTAALGHSTASMQKYFKDNSLILFAVNADNSRRVQITCRETEFSSRLSDLSLLDDETVLGLVNRFVTVKSASDLRILSANGMKFYEVSTASAAGCTVQYITIRGGKLYTVSFFENASAFSEDFKSFAFGAVNTLTIDANQKLGFSSTENITEIIIVAILLILAAAVIVTLIISFVRDFRRIDDGKRSAFIRRRKK